MCLHVFLSVCPLTLIQADIDRRTDMRLSAYPSVFLFVLLSVRLTYIRSVGSIHEIEERPQSDPVFLSLSVFFCFRAEGREVGGRCKR